MATVTIRYQGQVKINITPYLAKKFSADQRGGKLTLLTYRVMDAIEVGLNGSKHANLDIFESDTTDVSAEIVEVDEWEKEYLR